LVFRNAIHGRFGLMIPNRLMTILVAGTLLGASGCSGTRLRNLITRSDYVSLEELEAQDAAAETAIAESGESESSEQEAAADAGDEKKKSWFSFASLLGRSSDDSELSPDPFVDVEEAEAEETAPIETESVIESAAAETTDKYSATMTNIEDQAQGMFEKLAAAEAETAVEERVKLPEIVPASGVSTSGQQSFADFITHRGGQDAESEAKEVPTAVATAVAEDEQTNPFAAEPVIAATKNENDISDFDRLLGRTSNTADTVSNDSEKPAKDPFSSELFPELDQLIADGNAGPSVNEQSRELSKSTELDFQNPPVPDFETRNSDMDPFQVAARKHGFDEVQQEDPWAAFTRQDSNDTASTNEIASRDTAAPEGFSWGHQSQTPQTETFTVSETAPENVDLSPPQPVFQQVSAPDRSSRVTGGSQLSTDLSEGLTIPTSPAPQALPNSDFEQFAATSTERVPQTEAPLAFPESADTGFDEAFDAALIGAGPDARTGSSVTATEGWPTRTWIFLAGFAVVAYLLFAPARQNRPRA
jgi:hypothetical protein